MDILTLALILMAATTWLYVIADAVQKYRRARPWDAEVQSNAEATLELLSKAAGRLEDIAASFGGAEEYGRQTQEAIDRIKADHDAIWEDQQALLVASKEQKRRAAQAAAGAPKSHVVAVTTEYGSYDVPGDAETVTFAGLPTDGIWAEPPGEQRNFVIGEASADVTSSSGQLKIQQDTARLQKLQYEAQQETNRILAEASASTNELLQQLVRMYQRFFEVVNSGALKKKEE